MGHADLKQLTTMLVDLNTTFKGRSILHIKTNNTYVVTGFHVREHDMVTVFSYENVAQPVSFIRPVSELFDGRFALK